jgi:hypothetical protein
MALKGSIMKKTSVLAFLGIGFFAPIELMIIILMGIILIDTMIKLFWLRKEAKLQGRPFRDLFRSKILRRGYLFKSIGYMVIAGPLFPLDYYALTPFLDASLMYFIPDIQVAQMITPAAFTNILLIIFCLMELSSINENWFDLTGNNILSRCFQFIKKIRGGVRSVADDIREIKDDVS